MAEAYKNKIQSGIGTSLTTIYTTPADTSTVIVGLSLANIISQLVAVDVQIVDVSAGTSAYIIKNAPVPVGGSLAPSGEALKIILEAGDYIRVKSDTASSIDITASMIEVS